MRKNYWGISKEEGKTITRYHIPSRPTNFQVRKTATQVACRVAAGTAARTAVAAGRRVARAAEEVKPGWNGGNPFGAYSPP